MNKRNKNNSENNTEPSERRRFAKKRQGDKVAGRSFPGSGEKDRRFEKRKPRRRGQAAGAGKENRKDRFAKDADGQPQNRRVEFKQREQKHQTKERILEIKDKFRKKKEGAGDVAKKPVYDFAKVRELEKQRRERSNTQAKGEIRLNKYIANAGVCSRREADKLIAAGEIRVNNKVVSELGFKVKSSDIVKMGGQVLSREKMVYVLLNKPKDFITTTDDPEKRRTVMQLVSKACEERIYPVGRLDRATTGLLLLTNDGELASKLAHPSNNIKKVYQVELDKPISEEEVQRIKDTLVLDDGPAPVDEIAFLSEDGHHLGLELHIGRNRIVRRIFAHLGYEVVRLDRVYYAGLTKKDLPRGKWRFLTEKELLRLKK
ncbi:MAG: rRNA pseudouridine synthase [Cytophagales bacterium]|nr:rRNA pseudouridine synthase [Cytophagales bacterium]